MTMTTSFKSRSFADLETGTVVVVPSISFPGVELRKITGILHYEERLLFTLLSLHNPEARVVYVTSLPIDRSVVDYYLSFLADPQEARKRLHMISVGDAGIRALTEKILDSPDALRKIRSVIAADPEPYLLTFNVTPAEQTLARNLGVPLFGPAPEHALYGSKTGSRRIAKAAGVAVLEGAEDLWSVEEVASSISALRWSRPDVHSMVIKLNNGFSGQGNAIVHLKDIVDPLPQSPTTFCALEETWDSYAAKIAAEGAIVEELAIGPGAFSPSVQLLIGPDSTPQVVSTHDQILGDPDGQVYLGCHFPARLEYRQEIQNCALSIARVLAQKGVIGFFGIDFLALPAGGGYDIYLSEINLRMGGTTHPFAMARRVTGGVYDPKGGELRVGDGPRCYVASDNLKSNAYRALTPATIIDELTARGLAFDRERGIGVTMHLLGALADHGKCGAICIETSPDRAQDLYEELQATLDELAQTRT